MKNEIKLLDELINAIKEMDRPTIPKFEFYLILTLEIVRYEMISTGKISDISAEAIKQFYAFQSFELYRDSPDIYSKCSDVFDRLTNYNDKLKNYESNVVGVKDNSWIKYFEKSITNLILVNKPNNR